VKAKSCPVLVAAERLSKSVQGADLPADWAPSEELYEDEILANIRHEHTNYEQLLNRLPLCADEWDAGRCHWDYETDGPCLLQEEAHDTLKWAAKNCAERLYKQWQERQQSEA